MENVLAEAGWLPVDQVPEEWKDGREVLAAYGRSNNPSSWTEYLTCRKGHWYNRRHAMLQPQYIRLLRRPDQPDPVIALCKRLLEENNVLREALRRLVADADRNQRPGGGSSVPADIRALLGEQ